MNRSRETSEDFQFLLERYARERFLYRLGESQHRERYVLKGATLLEFFGAKQFTARRTILTLPTTEVP